MADYYPLLARALDGRPDSTLESRAAVYDRARTALHSQLRSVEPALGGPEIARERASLEEAIGRAERAFGTAPAAETDALDRPSEADVPTDRAPPIRRGGKRGRSLWTAAGLVAVISPIAVAAWLWRDRPAAPPAEPVRSTVAQAPPPPADPKRPERVGGGPDPAPAPATAPSPSPSLSRAPASTGTPPFATTAGPQVPVTPPASAAAPPSDLAVAQRAALVQENTADPQQPRTTAGRALWRLDALNAGQGQVLETVVRATIDVPEAGLSLQLALRRNRDTTLPASHTMELTFTTVQSGEAARTVRDVNPPLVRPDDGSRGVPLSGLSVSVKENVFLIGLSDLRSDVERNTELLLNRNWIELPLRFSSGQRATLVFEKGVSGDRVVADAFRQWSQP